MNTRPTLRLDQILVEFSLVKSRTQAQRLIESGAVYLDGQPILKPSHNLELDPHLAGRISIRDSELLRYVSRGGLKLEQAIERLKIDVRDLCVLDIGISTGGFTDCLLQKGAKSVIGVDVGHNQLDSRIQKDSRVTSIEGLNARDLTPEILGSHFPENGFDLVVIDVSFISLELIFPRLEKLLAVNGQVLALVKPQFEAGPRWISKGGLIKDPKAFEEVKKKIYTICKNNQLHVEDYFESSLKGFDGNQEFFVFCHRAKPPSSL